MQEEYAVEPETDQGRQQLTAGTRVVVEGAERLMPGQQVRIVTLDGSPADVAGSRETGQQTPTTAPAPAAGGPVSRQES